MKLFVIITLSIVLAGAILGVRYYQWVHADDGARESSARLTEEAEAYHEDMLRIRDLQIQSRVARGDAYVVDHHGIPHRLQPGESPGSRPSVGYY